jgi:uncharacterized protein YdbL (DUF1318 family)
MTKTELIPGIHGLRVLLLAAVLAFAGASAAVWAASLEQAKSQGLVGEQADGYLGVVAANAPTDVKALVADVNQKRKQKYEAIAQRNKTSLDAVEALAGKKAIDRTPAGQYVRPPSGQWVKK